MRPQSPFSVWSQVPLAARTARSVKSIQVITIAVGTVTGLYTAAISAVTLAKSILVPMSHRVGLVAAGSFAIANWDFASVTRIQVELLETTPTLTPANAKAMVVEYF